MGDSTIADRIAVGGLSERGSLLFGFSTILTTLIYPSSLRRKGRPLWKAAELPFLSDPQIKILYPHRPSRPYSSLKQRSLRALDSCHKRILLNDQIRLIHHTPLSSAQSLRRFDGSQLLLYLHKSPRFIDYPYNKCSLTSRNESYCKSPNLGIIQQRFLELLQVAKSLKSNYICGDCSLFVSVKPPTSNFRGSLEV